jgi:hypothetical protein
MNTNGSLPPRSSPSLVPASPLDQYWESLAGETLTEETQVVYFRQARRFLRWAETAAPGALSTPEDFTAAMAEFLKTVNPRYELVFKTAIQNFGRHLDLVESPDHMLPRFETMLEAYARSLRRRDMEETTRIRYVRAVKAFLRWAHESGIDPGENWRRAVELYVPTRSNPFRAALERCAPYARLIAPAAVIDNECSTALAREASADPSRATGDHPFPSNRER